MNKKKALAANLVSQARLATTQRNSVQHYSNNQPQTGTVKQDTARAKSYNNTPLFGGQLGFS